jgi:hypothetical protein
MRITWVLAGVGGLSAAVASASTQFTVILNQDQVVGGSEVDLTQAVNGQVVAGTNGQVGLIGSDSNGNPLVLYYDGTNWSTVMAGGDSVNGDTVEQFANLAISGNQSNGSGTRLTYVGINNDNSDAGVFQYDAGSAGPQEVAFDGENGGIGTLTIPEYYSGDSEPGAFLPIEVDAAGNVVFDPYNSSGNVLLVVGNITATHVQTLAFTSNPTSDGSAGSYTVYQAPDRLGISTDATGATTFALLNSPASSNNTSLYSVTGGTPTNFASGSSANLLLAVQQDTATGVNAALFEGPDPNTETFPNTNDVILHDSSGNHLLQRAANNTAYGVPDAAEMTTGGNLAYYVPTNSGGALEYYSLSTNTYSPTQVAAVGTAVINPFTSGNYEITQLSETLAAPMVNNSGLVVFDALVAPTSDPSESFQALLDWNGTGSPTVLLYAGEDIAGYGDIDPDGIEINSLVDQSDVFKDSLSDQGYLTVMATFDDDSEEAVLQTQLASVPEPASLAMLPVAGAFLMRRRRRLAQ